MTQLHGELFERPIHPDARLAGAVVGSIAGAYVAIPLAVSAANVASRQGLTLLERYGDYAGYERQVRGLTEGTMRLYGTRIDPMSLQGTGYHIHHRIPIKCGWNWSVPAWVMASVFNLTLLPAADNQAIGAYGC